MKKGVVEGSTSHSVVQRLDRNDPCKVFGGGLVKPGPGQQQEDRTADPSLAQHPAVRGEPHWAQLESDLNTPPAQRGILDFIN